MLQQWGELAGPWDTLLLGNGFSQGLAPQFAYHQLVTRAQLGPRLQSILDACGTWDFERGLLSIEHTLDVLSALGAVARVQGDSAVEVAIDALQVDALRDQLRDGLIRAVHESHPAPSGLRPSVRARVAQVLAEHRDVFTTNYDLLPYWCLMAEAPPLDYFWVPGESGVRFDLGGARDTAARRRRGASGTALHYLHGALHLRTSRDASVVEKVRAGPEQGQNLLRAITRRWRDDAEMLPLFVSEGSSSLKQARILASPYLAFAQDELAAGPRDVVVYGAGFNEQDAHIWRALRTGARKVAVSVFGAVGDEPRAHEDFIRRVRWHLGDLEVEFFWSSSHPLGSLPGGLTPAR